MAVYGGKGKVELSRAVAHGVNNFLHWLAITAHASLKMSLSEIKVWAMFIT